MTYFMLNCLPVWSITFNYIGSLIARFIKLENEESLAECKHFTGSWWNETGGSKSIK